jgi:hypothetical protein
MKTLITIAAATLILSTGCVRNLDQPEEGFGLTDDDNEAALEEMIGDPVLPETSDPVPASDPPPNTGGPGDDQNAADTSNTSGAASGCGAGSEPTFSGECEAVPSDGATCTGAVCDDSADAAEDYEDYLDYCQTQAAIFENLAQQYLLDPTDPVAVEEIAMTELELFLEAQAQAPDSLAGAWTTMVAVSETVNAELQMADFDPALVDPAAIAEISEEFDAASDQVADLATSQCGLTPPSPPSSLGVASFARALTSGDDPWPFDDEEAICIAEVIDPDSLTEAPTAEDIWNAARQCLTPDRYAQVSDQDAPDFIDELD